MNRIEALKSHPVTFVRSYMGSFYGVLKWTQLDELWQWISRSSGTWYVYQTDCDPPAAAMNGEKITPILDEIDKYLRQTHKADYCGVVYVDNLQEPEYIKVYNPKGMGSSCSMSEIPPLPKWILTREQPQDLRPLLHEPPDRGHWWQVWK